MKKKNVVVIGGGTGTHAVLSGLKKYQKEINISAVVTMADSGGSTGRLRDEFGYLPVGDVRMALTALASEAGEHEELLRQLFMYRFDKCEGLSGHNFGNLLLVALTDILGSEEAAIAAAARVLRVRGKVVPVTNKKVDLVAEYDDGVKVIGEHSIDEPDPERIGHKIAKLKIVPQASISETAKKAILEADLIVLGPGDLFTSVLANCVVQGVAEAVCTASAKVVYICNLMTKVGQTTGMGVAEHVSEIIKYTGRVPDYVFANNGNFSARLLEKYAQDNEFPVESNYSSKDCQVIEDDLIAKEVVQVASGDTLKRSFIRHNPQLLSEKLMKVL